MLSEVRRAAGPRKDASPRDIVHMRLFKLVLGGIIEALIYAGLLFLPAGTFHWWRGWVFLGVVCTRIVTTGVRLFRGDAGLFAERFKGPIQAGQPLADKIVVMCFVVEFYAVVALSSLDVFHLHLPGQSGLLGSSVGLVMYIAGWVIQHLSFRENAFAAPVVKYQEDRQHKVVDTGVYAVVRHPIYAGNILIMTGTAIWLGSYAVAVFAIVPIIVTLGLRVLIEESLLKRELKGYTAYMEKVRYRLIPFIW